MSISRLKIKRIWKLRDDPSWRALIRAYIADEKGGNRTALKDMPGLVAKYWTNRDDYVIGPGVRFYLELMLKDMLVETLT